ncbi:MAG TPA: CBS domain-containing protein [Sorangium sp.]|nr:CBS domain-containing protein [Sorangium sp.]
MTVGVQTVHPHTSLRDAHARMRFSGFRHLPVVDERQHLVGIVAASDIKAAWGRGFDGRCDEVMTSRTSAVHPDAPVREAIARMLADDVRSLPIVNADNRVVGIMTTTDLLQLAYRALIVQEYVSAGQ